MGAEGSCEDVEAEAEAGGPPGLEHRHLLPAPACPSLSSVLVGGLSP